MKKLFVVVVLIFVGVLSGCQKESRDTEPEVYREIKEDEYIKVNVSMDET